MRLQDTSDCAVWAPAPTRSLELARRIRTEYLEMPGLQLSADQAARLWAVDQGTCLTALGALVETGYLIRDGRGRYCKADNNH